MVVDDDIQAYGLSFMLEEKERSQLTYLLNQLQVKLRRQPLLPDSSFVTEDRKKYLTKCN